MFVTNLPPKNSDFDVIVEHLYQAIDRMEEFAQVIFFMAVEDIMPEKLALFGEKRWINIEAIGLDSHRWQEDGLFEPYSEPRDLGRLEAEIRKLFKFEDKKTTVPA